MPVVGSYEVQLMIFLSLRCYLIYRFSKAGILVFFFLCGALWLLSAHYENTPIQIYRKFHLQKLKKKDKSDKNSDIFFVFLLKNIDCGYSLEKKPPKRGGSNEYPQSMVLSRN